MEFVDHLSKLSEYVTNNPKHIIRLEREKNSISYTANVAKLLDHLSISVFDSKLSSYPDIKKKEYEGGFKIWECELDGAKFILDNSEVFNGIQDKSVLEIGCGSGLMGKLIRVCMLFSKT